VEDDDGQHRKRAQTLDIAPMRTACGTWRSIRRRPAATVGRMRLGRAGCDVSRCRGVYGAEERDKVLFVAVPARPAAYRLHIA
jgi:hypothetical protein